MKKVLEWLLEEEAAGAIARPDVSIVADAEGRHVIIKLTVKGEPREETTPKSE